MNLESIKEKADSLFSEASFLAYIKTEVEYSAALELMDKLIDDYDQCLPLINVLSATIKRYEDNAPEFEAFNKLHAELDGGVCTLRTLMDGYGLTVTDFQDEIGDSGLVSVILKGEQQLTRDHIEKLSKRFRISPALFFD